MKNIISINKYIVIGLVIVGLAAGSYAGFYFTDQHYQGVESKRLADEEKHNRENVLCRAEVMRGKRGEVKSEYYIFEQSEEQENCERLIDYNVPDDTEAVWMGF